MPALLPAADLARANSRLELARSAAFAAGPALAGALVAWAGASAAFVLATLLSGAAVALLLRLHEPLRVPAAPRHPLLELRDGALLVWQHALLRPILLTAVAWNIAWFVLQAAYVPYAMRALGLSAASVGLTLAAYGSGMVAGALLAPRIVARLSFGHAILLGPLVSVAGDGHDGGHAAVAAGCAGRARRSFSSASGRSSGPSPRPRCARPSRPARCSVACRRCSSPSTWAPVRWAPHWAVRRRALGRGACLWLALAGFVLQAAVIVASPVRQLRRLPAPIA